MRSFESSFEDTADKALERLSSQWSGKSDPGRDRPQVGAGCRLKSSSESGPRFKVVEESETLAGQSGQIAKADLFYGSEDSALTRLSSQWSGAEAKGFEEDDETAPSFLVDWKLWGVKLAILFIIPVVLVLGGGIRHLYAFSPGLAEYCHSQALTIQEAVFGKEDLGAADSHYSLAGLYESKGDYQQAIKQGTAAAKIFSFACLSRLDSGNGDRQSLGGIYLDKDLEKLRQSLEISARCAEKLNYKTLAASYWLQAVQLQPNNSRDMEAVRGFMETRLRASSILAETRQKSDAIKVLEDGFTILPRTESDTIFRGHTQARVKDLDVEAFRYAIELHLRLGSLYKRFSERSLAKAHFNRAIVMRRHLMNFVAARELNNHWKPFTPYMRNVLVVVGYNDDGRLLTADAYLKEHGPGAERLGAPARSLVLEKLPGHLNWRGSGASGIKGVAFHRFKKDYLKLLFTPRGVEISQTISAEPGDSKYLSGSMPTRHLVEELLKVSKSL